MSLESLPTRVAYSSKNKNIINSLTQKVKVAEKA